MQSMRLEYIILTREPGRGRARRGAIGRDRGRGVNEGRGESERWEEKGCDERRKRLEKARTQKGEREKGISEM